MLSLSLFTLRKQVKNALELVAGENNPLKFIFGHGEKGVHIPTRLQIGTEIKQFHRLRWARQNYQFTT